MSAPRPPRLIVNADDLGRSEGINAGIFAAHERGLVTSTTLMVGFPAAVPAARALTRFPRLGVGLHVTLSGARPLLPPAEVPSLVDAEGRFPRRPEGLGGAREEDVEREVRAQFARFLDLTGRAPTHLDSHHHSHRQPVVTRVLARLAREWGLPVRRASPAVAGELLRQGLLTTDHFEERFYGPEATLAVLLETLASLPPGTTELMCHPGLLDDELRSGSTYVAERETELAALTDPAAHEAVERHGLQLLHFGQLPGRP